MKDSLLNDPRILLWIAAVALSLLLLAVHPTTEGYASGLKYGLDLQGGSWLQLQLQGAIVQLNVKPENILQSQFNASSVEKQGDSYIITINGEVPDTLTDDLGYSAAKKARRGNETKITIMASPESIIDNYLKKKLDVDVKILSLAPVLYEIRTNVTRESLNELLAPVGGSVVQGEDGFREGVTEETVIDTKKILDSKLNRLGLQDIKVRTVGNKYILIDLAGVDVASARDIVGKPGKFEIRIQTEDNETMHVLYGDAVESVEIPRGDTKSRWGVPFALSEEGAQAFQKAAIDAGATNNPEAHEISMLLDKDIIFSAPLAPELAASLQKAPSRSMVAEVGSGDAGSQKAKELYIHLREGALPVNVLVIGSGQVAAALGSQFKRQMVIGGIFAILLVAGLVYHRYREKRIVVPMVTTSFSEVIMILGVWALMGWQLDLASIAGIILVIGTGVDHLIIITDELLQGGEAVATSIRDKAAMVAEKSSDKSVGFRGKVFVARLSRSFSIILAAAATTIAAMLPLLLMGFGALTGFALVIIIGVLIGVGIARPAYGRIISYLLSE